MDHYSHTCPYCFSPVEVERSEAPVGIMRCPACGFVIKLSDHGAAISNVKVFQCNSCNKLSLYNDTPKKPVCLSCGSECTQFSGNELPEEEIIFQAEEEAELLKKRRKEEKKRLRRSRWRNPLKGKWKKLSKKTRRAVRISVAAVIALFIGYQFFNRPEAIASSLAYADMQNVWDEFRAKNPYNLQIEGIKKYDDNSYVAIISEPSEFVSKNKLVSFFDDYNCAYMLCRRRIGYDGWVQDFVVSFNDLKEKDLPKFTKKLSKLLYNTDYKAHLVALSKMPEYVPFSDQDLNLQVSAPELRQWMITDKEPLISPKDSTKVFSLPELFEDGKKGIYFSRKPGFVVWILEKGDQKIGKFREQARMFSLDSDLILGAVSQKNLVAIIGRERSISTLELPPMRTETLRMLAGVENDELAQSYQRHSMFAGKLENGQDFAPILLSPQLWHTEYGSILNLTDQMLKSWSENGEREYAEFNHAKPVDFPFEKGAAIEVGNGQLTYNWNTKGLGYVVDDGDCKVYALNRTGSLPVSYITDANLTASSEEEVFQAEEKAYDFFSNLSSPNLAKVVQYMAMYQIFHHFGIRLPTEEVDEGNVISTPSSMIDEARETVGSLSELDYGMRLSIANNIDPIITIESYDEYKEGPARPAFMMPGGLIASVPDTSQLNLTALWQYQQLISKLDTVSALLPEMRGDTALFNSLTEVLAGSSMMVRYYENDGPMGINPGKFINQIKKLQKMRSGNFAEAVAFNPSDYEVKLPEFDTKKEKVEYFHQILGRSGGALQKYHYMLNKGKAEEYMQAYVENNEGRNREWIKCPTVVLSVDTKNPFTVIGGHNLNAGVTVFNVNRHLDQGRVLVKKSDEATKTLDISAADAASRVGEPGYLKRALKLNRTDFTGEGIQLKTRQDVASSTERRSARGFNTADHLVISREGKDYTINGKKTGATVGDLVNEAAANIDNGKAHTSVTLEFRNLCEDECMAIVESFGEVRLKKGSTLGRIPCEALDVQNIVTENLSNGNVRVKLAVRSTAVKDLLESSGSSTSETKETPDLSAWNRIRQYFMIFEVPKAKVESLVALIRSYVNDNTLFHRFEFRQRSKEKGIDIQEEIDALQVARNNQKTFYVLEEGKEKQIA